MPEPVKPIDKRPRIGRIWSVRCGTEIMVGVKQLTPRDTAIDGENGWRVFADYERQVVWLGYGAPMAWTAIPLSNVSYVRYRAADEETTAP